MVVVIGRSLRIWCFPRLWWWLKTMGGRALVSEFSGGVGWLNGDGGWQ